MTPSARREHAYFAAPFRTRSRRIAAAFVCAALVAIAALSTAADSASAAGCPGARSVPGSASEGALAAATLCLLNDVRRAHHLRPLGFDAHVAAAAQGWSDHLVGHFVLSHYGGGGGPPQRMDHAGFRCAHRGCTQGENIAWAPQGATPARIVRLWMHSAEHRRNMLFPRYAVAGIGIARRGRTGAMYVLDLAGLGH